MRADVRLMRAADSAPVRALYPAAFPDEDLLPLVGQLLAPESDALSYVAVQRARVVGHMALSQCRVAGQAVVLVGPLAVAPDVQRQGVGSALMRAGLAEAAAVKAVVLGDPAYYGRFGFAAERGIAPPYALPPAWAAAWQSLVLKEGAAELRGLLYVPSVWQDAALWS